MIATARQILTQAGKAPPMLAEHGRLSCEVGSPLNITPEKVAERIEWIEDYGLEVECVSVTELVAKALN